MVFLHVIFVKFTFFIAKIPNFWGKKNQNDLKTNLFYIFQLNIIILWLKSYNFVTVLILMYLKFHNKRSTFFLNVSFYNKKY